MLEIESRTEDAEAYRYGVHDFVIGFCIGLRKKDFTVKSGRVL